MDDQFPLRLLSTKDSAGFTEDGKSYRYREYRFKLGDQGWFTFRTPLEPFDADAFGRYVDDTRAHLRGAVQR